MADYSIVADIKANTSGFIDGLKKGEESLGSFSKVIEKVLGPKGKVILALAAVTTAAVKMGQEMNKAMTEIAKGTGKTGEELYKLRENAHDAMVEGVGRSAQEVGKMVADLNTRFGVTGQEVVELTKQFDKFSKVTGVDTSVAIEQCADVMKKWNIETEDASKLQDQLTVASQESGASVETLLNGLKSGQAVFSQFGMSATETIAFMADLKQNGIESEQALVGMKTALANFSKAGIDAQEGFAQVKDAIKNAGSETEALNIAVETFGSRNGPEMVKVLRNTANGAEEMEKKLLSAGGATEKTFSAMRTSKDAIDQFIGTLKGSFGGLFEGIDTLAKNVIDSVTRVFKLLDPLIRPIVNIIRDTLSTIGEMVYTVINSIADQIEQNSAVFASITEIFQSVYETMHTILGNMLEAFKTAFSLIFAIINGKWELAWEYTKHIFWLAVDNLLDILSSFLNLFSSQINVFIEKVINPLVDKWNWVAEKLNLPLADKFEPIKKVDLSKLTGVEKKVEEIDKKIAQLNGNAEKKITGTLGKVEKATSKTVKAVVKATEEGTEKQKTAWEKLKESIEKDAEDWSDVMQSAYGACTSAFTDMFTSMGEELIEGGASFEDYGATAVKAISQVLQSLGAQLLALSAARAANYDYGTAAMAAAGAAAAFAASGVMSGIAKQMKATAKATREVSYSFDEVYKKIETLRSVSSIGEYREGLLEVPKLQASLYKTIEDAQNNIRRNQDEINKRNTDLASKFELIIFPWLRGGVIKEIDELTGAISSELARIGEARNLIANISKEYEKLKNTLIDNVQTFIDEMSDTIAFYDSFYKTTDSLLSKALQKVSEEGIVTQIKEFKEGMLNAGAEISESFVSGLVDGLSGKEYFKNLRDYLRENLIKTSVYTEQYINKMSEYSMRLVKAMNTSNFAEIKTVKKEMALMYDTAKKQTEEIDKMLDGIFESAEDVIDSISEMTSTIAESLSSALAEGLTQSDFLEQMKDYIRKMLIQSLVYTETLKSEIASIGEAISKGITEGFTETSLHEIRRDLSWTFDQANRTISNIDEVMNRVFSGYAIGTNSATRGIHLVGEAGPELVNFRGGEQVLNNRNTQTALENAGGTTINQNVVFNNLQDTSAYAMISQLKQYNREMAINGII